MPRTTTTTPKDSKMSESTKQSLIWAISATLLSLFIWVAQLVTLANESGTEKMQVCVQQDMQWVSGNCIGTEGK